MHAEQADSLSMSFLVLLERLTPVERAVFLLHDVFDYDFEEVGRIVGRTPATCRQHAVRARRFVAENRPRFDASDAERDELVGRFFAAAGRGDVDGLIELLAEDVVVHGDGGGKVPQWYEPIAGADKVARLFAQMGRQMQAMGATVRAAPRSTASRASSSAARTAACSRSCRSRSSTGASRRSARSSTRTSSATSATSRPFATSWMRRGRSAEGA